jgi:hypothetical protein
LLNIKNVLTNGFTSVLPYITGKISYLLQYALSSKIK